MSFDYTSLQVVTVEMIDEFGRELTIRTPATGQVYDEVTGTYSGSGTPTEIDVRGIVLSPTVEYTQSVGEGSVHASDQLVYLKPESEPLLTDRIVIDDEPWDIVNRQEIAPGGIPLLYIVQVRR